MKLTVDCSGFQKALRTVEKVVARRHTLPILANIFLSAEDGLLTLRATDLELEMITTLTEGLSIEKTGQTTVPAMLLYNIVQKLPAGSEIALTHDGNAQRLTLKAGGAVYRLSTLSADEFPHMEANDLPVSFSIPTKDLAYLFEKTFFAVGIEESRYYLTGIYFHVEERASVKVLKVVATDGHRLATCEVPLPEGAEDMESVILPRKTVEELRKMVAGGDTLQIQISKNKIAARLNDVSLISKTIDATFPDYKGVVPSESKNDKKAEVPVKLFKEALERISTLSETTTRIVTLRFAEGRLTLLISSSESEGREELEIAYTSSELVLGFNITYLLDILNLIGGELVTIKFFDNVAPALVLDGAAPEVLFVLMPTKVPQSTP